MPRRIQLRRAKGWRLPAGAIKVDRSTKWGNPFVVGRDGTQAQCVSYHRHLLAGYMVISAEPSVKELVGYFDHVKAHVHELRGKDLACWCRPGTPCHADVLIEIANTQKQ